MLPLYNPTYSKSWGLIVGVDAYQHAPPLIHARSDAEGIFRVITERFGFPKENVTLLTNELATRKAIMSTFLRLANPADVGPDDRVIFFFAGHGHTVMGRRGETGFLVPVDGEVGDLSSLIRWNELTQTADLIPAKHVFFLMDACYGGLALSRKPLPPGSMRFLKDMLQRFSRQVLTAGKANEVVSDANGPRPGHSIFTGHVLNALEGVALAEGVIMSANSVMAYVYERVGRDPNSQQTPHYGFIDGDGDFVFDISPLEQLQKDEAKDSDLLVAVSHHGTHPALSERSVTDVVKELISDPRQQIRLDDYVSAYLRRAVDATAADRFPGHSPHSKEEYLSRLKRYEESVAELETIVALLARWGEESHLPLLEKVLSRLAENERAPSGLVLWLSLAWYPSLRLMYIAGIAALSARKYPTLNSVLTVAIRTGSSSGGRAAPIVVPVIDGMTEIGDAFKWLPGHERNHTPRSEYLFKSLQPVLEDLFFLGRTYEALSDRFEIFLALVYADLDSEPGGLVGGPLGRFAWKHSSRSRGQSPFSELVAEAEKQGSAWPPLAAGLFGGSIDRFREIATEFKKRLDDLHWW